MAKFKNKEEYEKWKAERGKAPEAAEVNTGITEDPQPEPTIKKCPHCAMDIPLAARVCPFCRKEQMTAPKALITVIGFAAVVMLIFWSQFSTSKPVPTATEEHNTHGEIEACVYSQMIVKNLLKAPSTADFGPCNASPDGAGFKIASYVDSQNSFGAKLRTPYAWDGRWYNKEWKTDFLALGSKTYIADGKIVQE